MKPRLWFLIGAAGAVAVFSGCGKNTSAESGHAHVEHDHGEEDGESGATFTAGRGLTFSPEVSAALGLRTARAEEHPLAAELTVTARVFATAPRLLASAWLPPAQADGLETSFFTSAKLVQTDRSATAATGLVELIFELDPAAAPPADGFVRLALTQAAKPVLAVPRSAVLDGPAGAFVYVVNSGAFLRTTVATGAQSAGFVAITDGLRAGDTVVVSPVEQLALTELRLSNGGGHSH